MNDIFTASMKALLRRSWAIILFTAAVGGVTVLRELITPPAYHADTLLIVTDFNAKSEVADVVPESFNPKIYEQFMESTAVVGEVLERLATAKAFGENEPPKLQDFMGMLKFRISLVDQTTRPINYSPLLQISTVAETPELAAAIIDTWASVAIEHATKAVSLRLAGASATLVEEQKRREGLLESIWKEMQIEEAQWDLSVMRKEMDARVELTTTLYQDRALAQRDLAQAQERVRVIQDGLLQSLTSQQDDYKAKLDDNWTQLATERSTWNLDTMAKEIDARTELLSLLRKEQAIVDRDMVNMQEQLKTLRETIFPTLTAEQQGYKTQLDAIWARLTEEESSWNITVLGQELDARVELLNTLYQQQAEWQGKQASNQERLRVVRETVTGMLTAEQQVYKDELAQLVKTLSEEQAKWNATVLSQELDSRVLMLNALREEQTLLDRDLVRAKERLKTVQESMGQYVTDESNKYKEERDQLYAKLEEDEAAWNLVTMQKEIDARVELLNTLYTNQNLTGQDLAKTQERLRMTREDLAKTLTDQEQGYSLELDGLLAKLADEMRQWNLEVIQKQLDSETLQIETLTSTRTTKQQELVSGQQRMTVVTDAFAKEKPYLELAQAPSDTAYWIVKGEGAEQSTEGTEKTMTDLASKVMVSQTPNPMYWSLKQQQESIQEGITGKTAELAEIEKQLAAAEAKRDELKSIYAEHRKIQEGLKTSIDNAETRYKSVATEQALAIKSQERDAMLLIAGFQATGKALEEQIAKVRADQEELQTLLAQHKAVQDGLRSDIKAAEERFTSMASEEAIALNTEERTLMLDIAGKLAAVQRIGEQLTQVQADKDSLQALLAEHQNQQYSLQREIKMAEEKVGEVTVKQLLELKAEERKLVLELATMGASLQSLADQIAKVRADQEEIAGLLAEHRAVQDGLKLDLGVLEENYKNASGIEYLAMKKQERTLTLDLAAKTASSLSLSQQMDAIRAEQEGIQALFAEHKDAQDRLMLDIQVNTERYSKVSSEELLALKTQEREALLQIGVKEAAIKTLDEQLLQISNEQKNLESLIAEHQVIQNRLKTREEIAKAVFSDIAQTQSFVDAAVGVTGVFENNKDQPVGLNRMSDRTYPIEDRGFLGKRGRVMLSTLLAACLSSFLVLMFDVGLPKLKELLA